MSPQKSLLVSCIKYDVTFYVFRPVWVAVMGSVLVGFEGIPRPPNHPLIYSKYHYKDHKGSVKRHLGGGSW